MTWENVPALLTAPLHGHRCVIYKGRLIVIGGFNNSKHFKNITEISLDQPCTRKLLVTMPDSSYFNGVATFGDVIVLVGTNGDGRTVLEYDITKNRFKKMGPLPFSKMTMIKWG